MGHSLWDLVLFVVETKNRDGWIFGDEAGGEWTQVLARKRFRFQNPLRQNYRHAKALSDLLGIDCRNIFSVVVFWGNCEFRTKMPPNVLTTGYTDYIKSKKVVRFDEVGVKRIVAAIKEARLPNTWATRRRHAAHLRERFGNTSTCPQCGGALVLRTARSSGNAGTQFYGCTRYPACRYINRPGQPAF